MSDGDAAGAESSLTLGASGAHAALESKSAPAGGSTLRFGVAGVAAMALLLGVGATAVAALAYQTYNNGANSQPAAAAIAVPPAVAAVPGPGPEPVTEAVAVEPPPPVEPPPTITEPTPPSVATPTPPRPKVKPIANVVQPEPAVLPPVTQAVVATLPVLPAATAAAKPAPEIVLKAVEVDQAGGVKIVLTMSNATVRPMHYLMEGASEDFPMQYVIEFKGGASEVSQRIAVGNSLVDSVTVSNSKGKLRISVNVKQAAKFGFTGTGPTWNIAVTPS